MPHVKAVLDRDRRLSVRLIAEEVGLPIITMLPHPPYSPDLASCDFFLFPKIKTHLKGHHLGQLKTSRQLRRGLCTTSQVKTSSTAMKSGSNAGIAVFDHKEPVLKGINCNCMYVQ